MGRDMVIEISRREVLNNLIRFKDILLERRGQKNEKKRRVYKLLVNRHTGDMQFAQKISALEHRVLRGGKPREVKAADWKEVYLIVDESHFDLLDGNDRPLNASELDPLAWKIAKETVRVLNLKSREVEGRGDLLLEEAALQDLSSIHLSPPREELEELPGWMGKLGRIDAERRLAGQPMGTYLLREGDPLTFASTLHLEESNHLSIQPYVLTEVDRDQKISEYLLLQTEKGWILFRDEPKLSLCQYISSPRELLHQIPMAKHPLKKK